MDIFLNKRTENNVTIIEFIDHIGDKIGQLVYEIIDDKAIIHDTFIYPDYRNRGVLKTYFLTIIQEIKQYGVSKIELSVLSDEAKIVWSRLGFIETDTNFFTLIL